MHLVPRDDPVVMLIDDRQRTGALTPATDMESITSPHRNCTLKRPRLAPSSTQTRREVNGRQREEETEEDEIDERAAEALP
jgi:hypothetical protein